jgi:hypothetical protein
MMSYLHHPGWKRVRSILSAARQRVKAGLGVEHNAFWQGIETSSPRKTKRKTA